MKICPSCHRPLPDEWFDREEHTVLAEGERRRLSILPWAILELLLENIGRFVDRNKIAYHLWAGTDGPENEFRNIITHVYTVRKALRGTPFEILNSHGNGWMIRVKQESRLVMAYKLEKMVS